MAEMPWERIRKRAGLTQQQVADGIGVSRALVSYWESGKRPMNPRWVRVVGYWDFTLADLAPLLGFEPSDDDGVTNMLMAEVARVTLGER